MIQQEAGPIHGGINASDCGAGKTLEMLGLVYASALRDIADPGVLSYFATLIPCPAPLVGQWIEAIEKFFPGIFTIRQYYGTPDTVSAERASITLGSDARDLDIFLGSLDVTAPTVGSLDFSHQALLTDI